MELDEQAAAGSTLIRRIGKSLRKPSLVEWCCLAGGLFLSIHYAWLLDDAFVYFRYIDNWLFLHFGLVFNKGEYVEGYSSPVWLLLLAAFRITRLNYWIIVRIFAVAGFVAFWICAVALNRSLSPRNRPVINFPLCYVSFLYGPLCYFTSGMETPLIQVVAAVFCLLIVYPSSGKLQAATSIAPLIRHELALPYFLCLLWVWFRKRRFPWMMLLWGALFSGAWVIFRVYYYADLFPNTFYLKNTIDIRQGLLYVWDTVSVYRLGFWFLFMLVVLAAGLFRPGKQPADGDESATSRVARFRLPERMVMLVAGLSVAAYVIKIGGDGRHYRYLAFPFCMVVFSMAGLIEQSLANFSPSRLRWVFYLAGPAIAALSVAAYPRQLSRHPFSLSDETVGVDKILDATFHRRMREMSPPSWASGNRIELLQDFKTFVRDVPSGEYRGTRMGYGCFPIYQSFDYRIIHHLGLTDPFLARMRMESDRPGHKRGLVPYAEDMLVLNVRAQHKPHRGMYSRAVERRRAPRWIKENIDTIKIIEQKAYNRHDFLENLRLAFTFPPEIVPPKPRKGSRYDKATFQRNRPARLRESRRAP